MNVVISTEHFQTAIDAPTPTLVLFGSSGCPWCKKQRPVVEAFAGKYPRIATLFVDIDAWPEIASRRRIAQMPTLVLYFGGRQVGKRAEGYQDAEQVEKWADEALR